MFRSVGKGIGMVGGGVIGGAVKIAGKGVGTKFPKTGEWMGEVGNGVYTASKTIMDNTGQFVDGVARGGYGIVKGDAYHKEEAWSDVKDSTGRTVKGIGKTVKYTADGAKGAYTGYRDGDKEQALEGLKQVGTVAAVSTMAFGVIDVLDIGEADAAAMVEIDTQNSHLEGKVHEVTGVPFERSVIDLGNGETGTGVYPVFDYDYAATIPVDQYTESNGVHISISNEQLYNDIMANPQLAEDIGLTAEEVDRLGQGETPEGYVWHHHEQPGRMEMMDREIHDTTGHSGGSSLWGPDSEGSPFHHAE